jgi:hypothetical protein
MDAKNQRGAASVFQIILTVALGIALVAILTIFSIQIIEFRFYGGQDSIWPGPGSGPRLAPAPRPAPILPPAEEPAPQATNAPAPAVSNAVAPEAGSNSATN